MRLGLRVFAATELLASLATGKGASDEDSGYGAGNIGSLYAAKLKDAGHHVTILARGVRFSEIRECGILLQDFHSGQKSTTRIEAVERLGRDDAYDLVLVILPRNRVNEVLPVLAANRNTPSVMFFGNNAGGPEEMIKAISRE
jgi:2-dehydropantoate 2-reductase